MGTPKPKLHRRPIYRLVKSPMGVLIPTYSKEHYEKVVKGCMIEGVIYALMLPVTIASILIFALTR